MSTDQKKANLKLGIILGSVALVFFAGFIAKVLLLNH